MKYIPRKLVLAVVGVLIVGTIWYLESLRPRGSSSSGDDASIPLPETQADASRNAAIAQKTAAYERASEITNPSGFINTDPFTIQSLIGKNIILIDFWTYSCINCQRTLPYVTSWYEKYKDKGLVVVGIHTPEFQFEHSRENVTAAMKKFGVNYPVVLDNDYGTWNAYRNLYWPRKYLIDIDGFIVYDHAGEGEYEAAEQAIQKALEERARVLDMQEEIASDMAHPQNAIPVAMPSVGSPETYFGAARNELLGNGKQYKEGIQTFQPPEGFEKNRLYFSGTWNIQKEFATNTVSGASILYKYNAKNIYLVAGADNDTQVTVMQDGKRVKTITVKNHALYTLMENQGYGEHAIELIIHNPGLQAFTFTFG